MKKAAFGVGIMLLVSAVVLGVGTVVDLFKVAGNKITQEAHKQMPIQTKIDLMEQKLKDLGPQIAEAQRVVASQEYQVEKLEGKVQTQEVALKQSLDTIYAMRDDLSRGETEYVYAGKTFSQQEVKDDLERKFNRYKAQQDSLDQQKQELKARDQLYKANQEKLAKLENARDILKTKVDELRARLATVEARQIENMETVDGSPTEEINKLYEEIDEQLAVEEKLSEMDGNKFGEIQVKETEQKNLLDQIDAMRNKDAANGKNNELIKTEL